MASVAKVKQQGPQDVDHYEPASIFAVARIMGAGQHRPALKHPGGRRVKDRAAGAHIATLSSSGAAPAGRAGRSPVTVPAFAGLGLGEALALRWRDIHFDASQLVIARSYSGGVEGATQSGKERSPAKAAAGRTSARWFEPSRLRHGTR